MLVANCFCNCFFSFSSFQNIPCSSKLYHLSCRLSSNNIHPRLSCHSSFSIPIASSSTSITRGGDEAKEAKEDEDREFSIYLGAEGKDDFGDSVDTEADRFNFEESEGKTDLNRRFKSPVVQVTELEELPEQWRRSRLAWLCKELPAYKSKILTRVLNAQRKWIRQDDCTYIAVHCMRIRENEASFNVYKWMVQQRWFVFDFDLATKLADFTAKEGKYLKCLELFDEILNQGLIPLESTFHILIVACLSSSDPNALEQACSVYSRMIHLGGYKPRLSLHNSLFRALVSRSGSHGRPYLKIAEFIFHNLVTSGLEIQSDIYGGLIWLHSYQEQIDKERIEALRAEMRSKGIDESVQVLVSVLRACSKEGNLIEAEKTWTRIRSCSDEPPTQAFVYLMETYSRIGEPRKSLEIFRNIRKGQSSGIIAYYKIIEILCKAQEVELANSVMLEFINSGMKPLFRSFVDLMRMFANLNLHDKVESTFLLCLENCHPNEVVYNLYLHSLVQTGNLDMAEKIFNQMHDDETIGVSNKSCNTLLRGLLIHGDHLELERMYNWMCQNKFDVESSLIEKVEYVLSLRKEEAKKSESRKLSKELREILVGLLLGGIRIEPVDAVNKGIIQFVFKENFIVHSILKRHIYNQFHEWLDCPKKLVIEDDGFMDKVPCRFATKPYTLFMFYADQFWPEGQLVIPKLIHRWITPRVLAYWYMYGGYRTSSGDILLKLLVSKEDAIRMFKTLQEMSLICRVKKKGMVYWIGFLGSNAVEFWKLTEPFILLNLKDCLKAGGN